MVRKFLVACIFTSFVLIHCSSETSMKRVIIDVDPGIDDAHALVVFLEAEKLKMVKIEAITITMGNAGLEDACKTLVRLLTLADRLDIPIYKGVTHALLSNATTSSDPFFGEDGFGDLLYDSEPDLTIINSKPAHMAINDIVNENPGEISLICLAPLTTIALASTFDLDMFTKTKEVFVMGGKYRLTTTSLEFNFQHDPEAAYIVMQRVSCRTVILPFEPCQDAAVATDWRFNVLKVDTLVMELVTKALENFYSFTSSDRNIWNPPDLYMAMAVLYPDLVKSTNRYHATVKLYPDAERGRMILTQDESKIILIEELDKEYFMKTLLKIHGIN